MQPGDHLFVQKFRVGSTAVYTHHGVYVGDDQVIHYAGYANGLRDRSNQKVAMITLQAFAGGQQVRIKHYGSQRLPHNVAVARAFERLHEDKYNVVTNNCEHFANACCTGEHRSEQVRRALIKTVSASAMILTRTPGKQPLAQAALGIARSNPKVALGMTAAVVLGGGCWALKQRYF